MKKSLAIALLSLLAQHIAGAGDECKPVSVPIMIPWGAKATPQNAWREYPRPWLAGDA